MQLSKILASLTIVGGLTAGAQAVTYTTVLPTPHASERSTDHILGTVFGGTFTAVGATKNLSNGLGITAQRLADVDANGDDRLWEGGKYDAYARARFAGYNQKFGYYSNETGGSYQNLFNLSGSGYAVSGQASVDLTDLDTLRWSRSGQGGTWTSQPLDNGTKKNDHMVTYLITGLTGAMYEGKTVWMLFWEDLDLGDKDYNDLAVELHRENIAVTPEPVTAMLSVMALSALGCSTRRRR